LLYDRDARVREVAADYLYGYLPDPNVLAALEGASIGDASPVVRLRARWSLMSMRERLDYVERSLGDAGLAVEDRLAPLILSQQDYCYELSASGLVALREIAAGTGDRAMRIAALKEFGRSGQAEYLDPILDAIHNDPERPVQQAALAALQAHRDGSYLDDDSVYLDALLDVVGEHADPDLRRSAVSRLRRDLGTPAVREALEALVAREEDDSIRALIVEALRPADAATPGTGLPTVLQLQ
jgi:HEAT repeat protein